MVDFPNSLRDFDDGKGAPSGMLLTAAETGADGIQVIMVSGECFGRHIEWFDEEQVTAIVRTDEETGQPMLLYQYAGRESWHRKRGFEEANNTWWRYPHEADPNEYREHCLRIVRKA